MEYERIKAILSSLSSPKKESTLPSKSNWWLVILISTIALLLYIVACVLYIITICKKENENIGLSLVIPIVENVITASSIVVSCFATYVSNYVNNACIRFAEKINLMNDPKFNAILTKSHIDFQKKIKNPILYINIICAVIFSIYFISSVIYYFNADIRGIQFISIGLGAISTILTIVLALTTTISYFSMGKYFLLLLELVKGNDIRLSNEANDLKIVASNKK